MDTFTNEPPPICRHILRWAERNPRRAATLARRQHPATPSETPLDRAWSAYTLGRALLAAEQLDQADTELATAAELFTAHGADLPALRSTYARLRVAFARSAAAELGPELRDIAQQFAQIHAPADAFAAQVQLALLYDNLGRSNDASDLLKQIEAAQPTAEPIDQARWHLARGAAAAGQGQFAEAQALLHEAGQRFLALHANVEQAKCHFQQAWVAMQREDLQQARTYYRQAEEVFRRYKLPIRTALAARGLGLLAMRSGQYDEAVRRTLEAEQRFGELGRVSDLSQCLMNLGNIYYYAGWWPMAKVYYQQAEALASSQHATGWQLKIRRNIGLVLHRQHENEQARALFEDVLQRARREHMSGFAAEVLNDLADVLASESNSRAGYEEALDYYEQAQVRFVELGLPFNQADSMMDQGRLMLQHGDFGSAEELFRKAAPLVKEHPANHWRVQHGLACCAEQGGKLATALELYREASRTVAGLRSTLALEAASSSLFAQAAQLHADALRCATLRCGGRRLRAATRLRRAAACAGFAASPGEPAAWRNARQQRNARSAAPADNGD